MKKIPKKVVQGLKQVGEETGKELVGQTKKIVTGVISGKELVGDTKVMTEKELAAKQVDDERKKNEEMSKLRGRDVEGEVTQIRKEKEQKEDEEEKFLEEVKIQREAEDKERQKLAAETGVSSNPGKRKKKRGSAFAKGNKKTSVADLSATSEFGKNKN